MKNPLPFIWMVLKIFTHLRDWLFPFPPCTQTYASLCPVPSPRAYYRADRKYARMYVFMYAYMYTLIYLRLCVRSYVRIYVRNY